MERHATGVPRPSEEPLPPPQALAAAQRLLDDGRPFHAHEVLEAAWKAAPAPERDLWQGLAQVAVGLTHARRGNAAGAAALLRRGADRVVRFSAEAPHGVDADGVARRARALADTVDTEGVEAVAEATIRLTNA